ncbi:MAG: lectin, partial [Caldimonas sp.]
MKRPSARSSLVTVSVAVAAAALLAACAGMTSSGSGMGFFVTSTGSGRGGDLGGLAGADRLCTSLATAAGAGNRSWRAYLCTQS